MGFFAFLNVYCLRVNLSVAIVAMVDNEYLKSLELNSTDDESNVVTEKVCYPTQQNATETELEVRSVCSLTRQGHHHNGDQAARRTHMMCSICVRRSTTISVWGYVRIGLTSFGSPPMYIPISSPIDTLSLAVFELFGWLQNRFRLSVRQPDTDTMTNTALETIASSSGKKESEHVKK